MCDSLYTNKVEFVHMQCQSLSDIIIQDAHAGSHVHNHRIRGASKRDWKYLDKVDGESQKLQSDAHAALEKRKAEMAARKLAAMQAQ